MMKPMIKHSQQRRLHLSPLRYPGGKARLTEFFTSIIDGNALNSGIYVEPYAGGAGAAINLLLTGQVERIAINDLDPTIYAFWKAAVHHSDTMRQLLHKTPVTIEEWKKQKAVFQNSRQHDIVTLGFATLFLNRTNRSGVLNAGPIGGMQQTGPYKLDARFNKIKLDEQLRLLGLYKNKIIITQLDGGKLIQQYANEKNALIYADPPYFNKAGTLYMNSFSEVGHQRLARLLNAHAKANWILTYDDVPPVHKLYSKRYKERFTLNYSAYRVLRATEVMVYSDSLKPN